MKHLIYSLIKLIIFLIILECSSFIAIWAIDRKPFSRNDYFSIRNEIVHADPLQRPGTPGRIPERKRGHPFSEVIHPYLGYIWDPSVSPDVNEFGMLGQAPISDFPTFNGINVGIFGGSVAKGLACEAGELLTRELGTIPRFMNREIRILNFCVDGYKQPQQAIALMYFLSLGVDLDIVLNIDGFNEVAIPPAQNIPKGVFPTYPRQWFLRTQGQGFDTESLARLGEISFIDRTRRKVASIYQRNPLSLSPFLNLVWRVLDTSLSFWLNTHIEKFELYEIESKEELSYITTGPTFEFDTESDLYYHLASVWEQCSLIMHNICQSFDILYFHYLQPNQYVPNSKPFSEWELEYGFRSDHPYRTGVVHGYPHLRKLGKKLRRNGVHFHDLSMRFSQDHETRYSDDCCHFTKRGYDLIARRIMQHIHKDL